MPQRPLQICNQAGCNRTSSARYCSSHLRSNTPAQERRDLERRRGSACKRGYGRRWEKLRKLILARDPLCRARVTLLAMIAMLQRAGELQLAALLWPHVTKFCDGTTLSTDVDHVIAKPLGDDSEDNLQGICHSCHSYKTAVFDSHFTSGGRGVKFYELLALADRPRQRNTRPRNKNFAI